MVFADKAYCLAKAQDAMKKRGAYSAAILKQNMKAKNKDLDRLRSTQNIVASSKFRRSYFSMPSFGMLNVLLP
ncbi:MAG: hypothetical protein EXS67_02300 [Candidatus Margulisbacteria bacterium]|nr:hypothetical protein [Candidatus Margulisiibacteriota bacterium]